MAVTFHTVLDTTPGPIGLVVPEDAMAQLGPAKRYPVVVTLAGYSYRNTVSWYKGAFRIAFSSDNRAASGLKPGDAVDVTLELDDAPRVLEIPAELSDALTSAGVLEKFTALSYSKQRTFVDPWVAAKSQETRDKNLAKAIAAL
ncbi:MAG: YdeI/OmpD-associated family protein [Rhodoglobus sp.]